MTAPLLGRLAGRSPLLWGAVFGLGMVLTGWLVRSGRIESPYDIALVALFSLSLFKLRQSALNRAADCGIDTPALRSYNRRALIWALSYVALLGLALSARNLWHPGGPVLWLLALLPSLTIGYFVWALWRYLADEADEYQRMRQIQSALFGTAVLLVVASTWGFLETFGIAPHAEGWWAVAIFAAGQGLGSVVQNRRERRNGGQ